MVTQHYEYKICVLSVLVLFKDAVPLGEVILGHKTAGLIREDGTQRQYVHAACGLASDVSSSGVSSDESHV